jgi:GTP-binding protein
MVVERGGQRYRLIDTAGIRKKKNVEYGPEFFGINRSFKAIRRSDVVLLVIDALDGVTE